METHTLEPILPTIKSRCWIINFSPINIDDVKAYLIKKFDSKVSEKVINNLLINFNGENISDIIEELYEYISSEKLESIENHSQPSSIFDFIEFFRYIYLSNYYKAMKYLDDYNLLSDRRESIAFIENLLKFCYAVLKTKISSENKDSGLVRLANVIDENNFNRLIEFLSSAQNYIENYVNTNLIMLKIIILIKNSFRIN